MWDCFQVHDTIEEQIFAKYMDDGMMCNDLAETLSEA